MSTKTTDGPMGQEALLMAKAMNGPWNFNHMLDLETLALVREHKWVMITEAERSVLLNQARIILAMGYHL